MTAYKMKLALVYGSIASIIVLGILAKYVFEELIFLLPAILLLASYIATRIKCPNCGTSIAYRPPGTSFNDGRFSTLHKNKSCKYCGGSLDAE